MNRIKRFCIVAMALLCVSGIPVSVFGKIFVSFVDLINFIGNTYKYYVLDKITFPAIRASRTKRWQIIFTFDILSAIR